MNETNNHNGTRWAMIAIALVAVAIIAALVMRKPAEETAEAAPPAANTGGRVPFRMEQQWLIKLKLALAEQAEMAPQINVVGRVVPVPSKRAIVAPPVSGIIQSGTMPRVGQQVARGQSLATLVQTPTAAEAAQIHIENMRVDAERRRLEQAEIEARARSEEATHDAGRARRLYQKKAYSQKALEVDELEEKAKEAQLAAIQEQLKALRPLAASAATYEVNAPISGTIVSVNKSTGEQVAAGEAFVEIIALDTVWVEAPIFEKDLGRINRGAEARFTTTAFPDKEFRGRLININAVVDEHTRAATAVFEVNNASGELRAGMQANVRLDGGAKTAVLLVPKESVLDNEGQKIVYVLRSGEEFERRDVVTGDEYGSKVAIGSGVKPGERIVTQGAYQLKLQELKPANAGAHTHEI
jgi:cobalt-zinc-cadmium efflux system membrane fusion protein